MKLRFAALIIDASISFASRIGSHQLLAASYLRHIRRQVTPPSVCRKTHYILISSLLSLDHFGCHVKF